MRNILILITVFFLASCGSMPKHKNIRSDDGPSIVIIGASAGAEVYVDDRMVGIVDAEKSRFGVKRGTHKIVVMSNGQIIVQRNIFIEDDSIKEINVN